MKRCTTCRTTYTDDSLRYCLADGGSLMALPDDEATLVSPKREPMRVDVGTGAHSAQQTPVSSPSVTKIVVVVGLFGFLILAAAGIAGALLYFNRDTRRGDALPTPTPTPAESPVATPDLEKQKLQDQLANIQKQLDEQKTANKTSGTDPTATPSGVTGSSDLKAATVNSPGDGFLALRDKPHAEFGNRIEKIPHGVTITIGRCGPIQRRLGGRVGRWCTAAYNGKTGFVFDAFLDRN